MSNSEPGIVMCLTQHMTADESVFVKDAVDTVKVLCRKWYTRKPHRTVRPV